MADLSQRRLGRKWRYFNRDIEEAPLRLIKSENQSEVNDLTAAHTLVKSEPDFDIAEETKPSLGHNRDQPMFDCNECPLTFNTQTEFEDHFSREHKVFHQSSDIKPNIHLSAEKVKTEDLLNNVNLVNCEPNASSGQYECNQCEARFRTHCLYEYHINSEHLRVKPYLCEYCTKGLYSRRTLAKHLKEEHFVISDCKVCDPYAKDSVLSAAPNAHNNSITGSSTNSNPSTICDICGLNCLDVDNLNYHKLAEHRDLVVVIRKDQPIDPQTNLGEPQQAGSYSKYSNSKSRKHNPEIY